MTSAEIVAQVMLAPAYAGLKFKGAPDMGEQVIYLLDNGYGLSIVNGLGSYCGKNTAEVAVIRWRNAETDPNDDEIKIPGVEWNLCYHTPVADDVVGYQTPAEIRDMIVELMTLPGHECDGHFRDYKEEGALAIEEAPLGLEGRTTH